MKKINLLVSAAVALFTAASCQKEMANETIQNEGGVFKVTASTIADTKTLLSDDAEGNKIYWTPGDKISLFNSEGVAVDFSSDITENSTTAEFTNDAAFVAPESLVAIYPNRGGVSTYTDGVIDNLRIAGTQTAVAGSFDPSYAIALGLPKEAGSTELNFTSIHALLKFTIGGDKAPTTVTLTNNGWQNIAGLFTYNVETGATSLENGAKTITLKPKEGESFEIGKTYYIAFRANCNLVNMTLAFDGKDVKVKSGTLHDVPVNTIFNMGTVSMPVETEEPVVSTIDVTRVWGHYSTTAAWSNSLVSSLDGNDRSLAMDDEYIYIPETNQSGNIHKFKIADGSYVGKLPIIDDLKTGTHYTSCARMVKNTDPAINGGKDVLVVCNLAQGGKTLVFAAYINGTENAPVKIWSATNGNGRRFGDKFSAFGSYATAKYWVRTYQAGDSMTAYAWPGNGWNWLEPSRKDTTSDVNNIGEIAWYPGNESYCLISTNSEVGAHLMDGATEVKTYPALAKTFGYNFFEVGENKFVAWTSLKNGNALPRLQIVQSDASSLEKMMDTFDNLATRLVYEAPLQNADDMNTAGVAGGNTVCDCCVREIDGTIYIAAMAQKAGLSLFMVTAK